MAIYSESLSISIDLLLENERLRIYIDDTAKICLSLWEENKKLKAEIKELRKPRSGMLAP